MPKSRLRTGLKRSDSRRALEAPGLFLNLVRVFSAYQWHGAAGHNTYEAGAYLACADRLVAVSPTDCHAPPSPAVGLPRWRSAPNLGHSPGAVEHRASRSGYPLSLLSLSNSTRLLIAKRNFRFSSGLIGSKESDLGFRIWLWRASLWHAHRYLLHRHVSLMAATGKSKTCVWRWQERFMHEGVDGLLRDKTRPPGKQPVPPERVAEIVRLTQEPPPHEATHWTLRAMAKAPASRPRRCRRIWKAHGLSPHRWRQFKLSNDPPSPRSSRTSSGSMSIRRPTPWCSRSTRRARSRRSTAPSRACR
jgi:hypothetical protein